VAVTFRARERARKRCRQLARRGRLALLPLPGSSLGSAAAAAVYFERADGTVVSRDVRYMDASAFFDQHDVLDGYVFTSMPDIVEAGLCGDPQAYVALIKRFVRAIVGRLPPRAIAIFYQSDSKIAGEWLDKSFVIQAAAAEVGGRLLWHKIVLFAFPAHHISGKGRPQYSHMLALAKGVRNDEAWVHNASTPDVLLRGDMPWARAMGVTACDVAIRFLCAAIAHEAGRPGAPRPRVIDPFCGQGTALAVANEYGLDALGVELNRKRCDAARTLRLLGSHSRECRWSLARGGPMARQVPKEHADESVARVGK